MPRVTRRPLAALDIFDIWDHIAADSLGEADRWVDKLDGKFNLIATQPLMGRAREELFGSLRSVPFGRNVIFYVPSKTVSTWCACSMAHATSPQFSTRARRPFIDADRRWFMSTAGGEVCVPV